MSPEDVARVDDNKRRVRKARGANERIVTNDVGAVAARVRSKRPSQLLRVDLELYG